MSLIQIVADLHETQYWPEGLFTHRRHILGAVGQHGRRVKISFIADALPAGHQACALGHGFVHLAGYPFELALVDQGADIDAIFETVAWDNVCNQAGNMLALSRLI
jgi:hypothetical protein